MDVHLKLHERYIDDTSLVGTQTEIGARYDGQQLNITEESVNEDEGTAYDARTMKLLQTIANTVHHSIRMTIDYPSKHADAKVPMLDVKM